MVISKEYHFQEKKKKGKTKQWLATPTTKSNRPIEKQKQSLQKYRNQDK